MIGSSLLLAAAALPSTLPNGLVGGWKLDGNANDVLGVSNGVVQAAIFSWSAGKIGQAFYNAGAGRVNLGSAAQIKPTTAITVGGWFWFNGTQGGNLRVASDWHQTGAVSDRWILGYSPDGAALFFHIYGVSFLLGQIGTTIATGAWVHLVATWSSGAAVAYRDGTVTQAGSTNTNPLTSGSGANVCLGGQEEAGALLDGRADDFYMWSRALSAAEVSEWWNAGAGKTHPFT